jgi:hypothetical protein
MFQPGLNMVWQGIILADYTPVDKCLALSIGFGYFYNILNIIVG